MHKREKSFKTSHSRFQYKNWIDTRFTIEPPKSSCANRYGDIHNRDAGLGKALRLRQLLELVPDREMSIHHFLCPCPLFNASKNVSLEESQNSERKNALYQCDPDTLLPCT